MSKFFKILLMIVLTLFVAGMTALQSYRLLDESTHDFGEKLDSQYVHLCTNTREYYDSLLSFIDHAQDSVYLELYEMKKDPTGMEFMDHLIRKSKEGVKVQVVLDGLGSANQWNEADISKGASNLTIEYIDTLGFAYLNHLMSRDHRNLAIIDGKWVGIGCASIADKYLYGLPELGNWTDMGLIFNASSDDVAVLEQKADINAEITRLIGSATRQIDIMQPYLALPPEHVLEIEEAIKRGVTVRFLIGEQGDRNAYRSSSIGFLRKMQKQGARVWICPTAFIHSSTMCVDGKTLLLSSESFNYSGLQRNVEVAASVCDDGVCRDFLSAFSALQDQSFVMNDDWWKEQPLSVRTKYILYDYLRALIL